MQSGREFSSVAGEKPSRPLFAANQNWNLATICPFRGSCGGVAVGLMYPKPPVGSPARIEGARRERVVVEIRRHPQIGPVEHVEELRANLERTSCPPVEKRRPTLMFSVHLRAASGNRRRRRPTCRTAPAQGRTRPRDSARNPARGSMQLQLGSFRNSGWPSTRFMRVFWKTSEKRLFCAPGTAISEPLE